MGSGFPRKLCLNVYDSGQVCMFQSKICLSFRSFTTTLLREVPGYMERIGSGVRFMLQETGRMGLPSPLFRETQEFVVTFPKEAAQSQQSPMTFPATDLNQETRVARAMQHIQIHGSISNSEYQAINNVSDNTALRDLSSLVSQGALREVGKGRARRYKLP